MSGSVDSVAVTVGHGAARVILDRPTRRNALSGEMLAELLQALESVARDPDVRVLTLRGAGGTFSTGYDLAEIYRMRQDVDERGFRHLAELGSRVIGQLATGMGCPVIAAVDGLAAGAGLGLALACDLIVATTRSTFGVTQPRLGLHPDAGLTLHLPHRVGAAMARELMWTGRIVDVHEAQRLSLVDHVVQPHALDREAASLESRILSGPPRVVSAIREVTRTDAAELADVLQEEVARQVEAFASEESLERMSEIERRFASRTSMGAERI